jgi:hypothetical protein
MRLLRIRLTAVQIVITLAVVTMSTGSFGQGNRTDDHGSQPKPSKKDQLTKAKAGSNRRVTRRTDLIRFRVIDDDTAKPISLARIVIDNGNLAPDLGQDSDAVTWPDGRAIIVHHFLFWEARRGEEKPDRRILQGPWIHATADGYEPKKMPLSDLLEQKGVVSGPFQEAAVSLHRKQPGGPDLADLAGDYTFGDGFVHQRLEISLPDRYHFKWTSDVILDKPHHNDRYESRGTCAFVDGVLRLAPEGPFSSDLRDLMGNNFVPVRWGDRRYLIPEKKRVLFCSVVNQGVVPKYMRSGPFSLAEANRRKSPEGRPDVPPEWAPFLLPKPVTGTITEVLDDQVAIMNAGAKDGLKSGMEFLREKDDPFFSRIKVLFTEAERSFVRIGTPGVGPLPDSSSWPLLFGGPFGIERLGLGEKVSSRSSDPKRGL